MRNRRTEDATPPIELRLVRGSRRSTGHRPSAATGLPHPHPAASRAELRPNGSRTPDGSLQPLMTVRELAQHLSLHEKTVYDWVARGTLPCVRLGHRLRFDPHDVLRWLSARKED